MGIVLLVVLAGLIHFGWHFLSLLIVRQIHFANYRRIDRDIGAFYCGQLNISRGYIGLDRLWQLFDHDQRGRGMGFAIL